MSSNIIKVNESGLLNHLPPFPMINTAFRIGYLGFQDKPAKKEIIGRAQHLAVMVQRFLGCLLRIKGGAEHLLYRL
jgi:hypothetical protein